MEELKPCPFCGGEAELIAENKSGKNNETNKKAIICNTRGCFLFADKDNFYVKKEDVALYWYFFDETAIKAWHTRAGELK